MCIPTPRGCNLARREIVSDITTESLVSNSLKSLDVQRCWKCV